MSSITEIAEDASAEDMVKHLTSAHQTLVKSLQVARDLASAAQDNETEDLMVGRIQIHEKAIWMMKSFLG